MKYLSYKRQECLEGALTIWDMPEEEVRKEVLRYINGLSEDRKIEALVTFKNLVDNGTSWLFIYGCCIDPYTDFEKFGFNLIYDRNYRSRIERNLEMMKVEVSDKNDAKNKLTDYLFKDIKDQVSAWEPLTNRK